MPAETDLDIADELAEILRLEIWNEQGEPMAEDQVRIYNQKVPIPEDDRAYVVISFRRTRPIGIKKTRSSLPALQGANRGTLTETIVQTNLETYAISLFSAGDRAQHWKNQIIFALNSDRAERHQEVRGYKLANIPEDFVDASAAEASRILNRYDITFNVTTQHARTRAIPYYDELQQPVLAINQ